MTKCLSPSQKIQNYHPAHLSLPEAFYLTPQSRLQTTHLLAQKAFGEAKVAIRGGGGGGGLGDR